ncbi:alpha/beta hydrolase [Alkalihalobacillus sp. BA299]|uniref:alpha/beta hydrolase n=1 Tax=Alkalihalobacillus sp. BA299 TaxID=2815938 RepID=UPI001ADC5A1A|nr:alpha/beta hydrolase [Alkalihalobacillus sp. BA299]
MNLNRIEIQKVINHLQNQKENFDFKNPFAMTEEVYQYLKYYKLPHKNINYRMGDLPVDHYKIKVQMFSSMQHTNGEVVLLLHGYLDHAGVLSATIRLLTDEGYTVITFDWPGHGLSSGERANISNFSEYQRVYESLIQEVRRQFSSPIHVIAHSTGAAVVINNLLTRDQQYFHSIILVAPLIRSNLWAATKFGYYFMKPIVKKIKRVIRENSSDQQFIQFIKQDPCQPTNVPLNWLKALIDWNDQIHAVKGNEQRVFVLQGIDDETVDWKYNCRFIAKYLLNSKICLFDGGKHHLLNEKQEIRVNVYKLLLEELKSGNVL